MEGVINLDIHISASGKVAILTFSGRFDSYYALKVTESLDKTLENTSAHILIDLSSVTFLDSTALASLVQGMKHARQQGGDLYICGLQPAVRTIFELTRLDKAFHLYDNQADALQMISV